MYKECDSCKSIFKINKTLSERISLDKPVLIYCPFCSDTSNHTVTHGRTVGSIRGYIK